MITLTMRPAQIEAMSDDLGVGIRYNIKERKVSVDVVMETNFCLASRSPKEYPSGSPKKSVRL